MERGNEKKENIHTVCVFFVNEGNVSVNNPLSSVNKRGGGEQTSVTERK